MWEYVQQTQADEPNLEDEIDRDDFDMLLQQYSQYVATLRVSRFFSLTRLPHIAI
jgi:hypothetical protein